ncbi:hypothetical protein PARMER_02523 [Parabacteroides merdae ATCC 43184]|nr:hypothetical protein PARMER_02523 [Parabacteroides merdae ATCC 43184]
MADSGSGDSWKLFEKSPNRFPSPRMICTFVTLFKKQ